MAPLNTNQTPSCAPPLQSVAVFLVMRGQLVEKAVVMSHLLHFSFANILVVVSVLLAE